MIWLIVACAILGAGKLCLSVIANNHKKAIENQLQLDRRRQEIDKLDTLRALLIEEEYRRASSLDANSEQTIKIANRIRQLQQEDDEC